MAQLVVMYSYRSVFLSLIVAPLVTAPITVVVFSLFALVSAPSLAVPELLGWGLLWCAGTVPTVYAATLLAAPAYLFFKGQRRRLVTLGESLVAGSITGLVTGAAWLLRLAAPGSSLEAGGYAVVLTIGLLAGASVASLLRLMLRLRGAT